MREANLDHWSLFPGLASGTRITHYPTPHIPTVLSGAAPVLQVLSALPSVPLLGDCWYIYIYIYIYTYYILYTRHISFLPSSLCGPFVVLERLCLVCTPPVVRLARRGHWRWDTILVSGVAAVNFTMLNFVLYWIVLKTNTRGIDALGNANWTDLDLLFGLANCNGYLR